jgi:3',5'-nucleoside bisphosphate phosphatase
MGQGVRLPFYTADLHLHTVLSPCAEVEMLPEFILERAGGLGLSLIAVTDHNSAENCEAVMRAAEGTGIAVLPGMEVQTREEVHLLCLFDRLDQALEWQKLVYASLPPLKNKPEVFGSQIVLDADGEPVGFNDRLLVTSALLTVDETVRRVAELGGLVIPSHVDRPMYSIIANLGFIPRGLRIRGVEISHLLGAREARAQVPGVEGYTLVANGDAHRLKEMACRTTLKMDAPTVVELDLALAGKGGRGVWVDGVSTNDIHATLD